MNIRDHPVLYQWDTNRYLDIPEADAVYVDFARTGEEPLRIAVADGGVRIPDSWLQTAGNQNIYICYVDGTLRGYTLRIVPRPKPPDYVATPDEAQSYARLDKKITDEVSRLDDRINNIPEGKDGITPTIGDNGNWYLGDTDTGKPSRGLTGEPGKDGHSPVVTATKSGKTTTISVDGTAIATVEDGADGKTPEYGVDYGTPEQISGIAQQAAEILQPGVDQIKDDIANVQLAVSEKMDSYTIKTVMDSVATPHTQYYLGNQTAVDIVLPDTANVGQIIMVCWYNGETAATLSITGTMLDFDYTPSANTRSEINALWDGLNWAVLGNEMAVVADA